ncbi:leukocyte immunoglobulin-like receptor subfamily B member 5 [Trachemys scripta elegans]|uniref:leukocyte immunoglobulin-like receptor subfamily B member 5 n=1 Tax=Trachemys scripta elegans TaxID=31138 RepID=UPI001554E53B|nr:leukocyte immunoglobulin-like receptor subfamily B member 5 [Trachemys scripta elegans]
MACLLPTAEPSYPKPNIYLRPGGGVSLGGAVTVWCRGQRRGVRFVLNKEGRHFPSVDSDGFEVVFPISNVSREDRGSYSCSYHSRSEPFAVSYPSNPMELVVRGGTDLGHPGAAPAPTRPGSPGPGGSESPASLGLTSSIITRASAAAAGLLLLLVAFVCFRITRARRRSALRLSSTSPLRVLKTPAMQDPVYASIDEGKETQTLVLVGEGLGQQVTNQPLTVLTTWCCFPGTLEPSSAPDVTRAIIAGVSVAAVGLLPLLLIFFCYRNASNNEGKEPQTLEPDPGTYAELDLQTLQPSVYAVINVSQGVPQ